MEFFFQRAEQQSKRPGSIPDVLTALFEMESIAQDFSNSAYFFLLKILWKKFFFGEGVSSPPLALFTSVI